MDANQIEKLKALALAATAGPWQWWTSNSTLRLTGADGRDGGVLHGYAYSGGGDVACSEPNRAYIEAANPAAVLELIAEVERLRAEVATRDALLRALNAVAIERGDKFGACDCIDNRGNPYPSQHLADVLKEGLATPNKERA
jgi:hypothetical protein